MERRTKNEVEKEVRVKEEVGRGVDDDDEETGEPSTSWLL